MFVEQMERASAWITATPPSQVVQALDGYVPGTQSLHILAVSAVVASSTLLNLRSLGVMCRSVPVEVLGRRLQFPLRAGIVILVLSGLALLLAEPERSLTSQVFQLKMLLLVFGCALAWKQQANIRSGHPSRSLAVLLLLIWPSIVFAGRWIAYAQY